MKAGIYQVLLHKGVLDLWRGQFWVRIQVTLVQVLMIRYTIVLESWVLRKISFQRIKKVSIVSPIRLLISTLTIQLLPKMADRIQIAPINQIRSIIIALKIPKLHFLQRINPIRLIQAINPIKTIWILRIMHLMEPKYQIKTTPIIIHKIQQTNQILSLPIYLPTTLRTQQISRPIQLKILSKP